MFFQSVVALALGTSSVLAAPAKPLASEIETRGEGSGITARLCWNKDYNICHTFKDVVPNTCYDLDYMGYSDEISSFQLWGNTCTFFKDEGCSDDSWETNEDNTNLKPTGWNDKFTSFSCAAKPVVAEPEPEPEPEVSTGMPAEVPASNTTMPTNQTAPANETAPSNETTPSNETAPYNGTPPTNITLPCKCNTTTPVNPVYEKPRTYVRSPSKFMAWFYV